MSYDVEINSNRNTQTYTCKYKDTHNEWAVMYIYLHTCMHAHT